MRYLQVELDIDIIGKGRRLLLIKYDIRGSMNGDRRFVAIKQQSLRFHNRTGYYEKQDKK